MIAVGDPHEHIDIDTFSLYNFHYREWMERGLNLYYSHGKPLAFDETLTGIVSWNREIDGFPGQNDVSLGVHDARLQRLRLSRFYDCRG